MRYTSARLRAGRDRWLVSYADLVTLLFACFTTTYAAARIPQPDPAPAVASVAAAPVVPPVAAAPQIDDAALLDSEPVDAVPAAPSLRSLIEPIVASLGISEITVVEDARGLVISLPESATFPTASTALTADAKRFLARLGGALRQTSARIRIEGHTDDVPITGGRYASNWELSTARASAVVLFLIDEGHFEPDRLSAAGYGEFHPRVPNDTPEGRALNRRVDVVVTEAAAPATREEGLIP